MSLVVKVTRKYQVALSKEVRETLGIRISGPLRIRVEDERIILEPLISRKKDPLEDMLGLVSKPVNVDAVKLVEESWDEG